MSAITARLLRAINDHDPAAMAALCADDYRSEQPAHPDRSFIGSAQVQANWTQIFAGVPDLRAELVAQASAEGTGWTEWRMSGSHLDGTPFEARGVIVLDDSSDRMGWARLYIEPVEQGGAGIEAAALMLAHGAEA